MNASPSPFTLYSKTEDAWTGMYQAIFSAKKSVYWEVFTFIDDIAGKPFFQLLEEKAQTGVEIKIILDLVGSFWVSRAQIDRLRRAGIDLRFFTEQKHRPASLWRKIYTRTHRKVLVIDGRVGFVGGVNIQEETRQWLDIHVALEGPIIASLLRAFVRSYLICGGKWSAVKHVVRRGKGAAARDSGIELLSAQPNPRLSKIREAYTRAIRSARERIILFTPYYFPDRSFLDTIRAARRRHVAVDVILPERSDLRIASYASEAFFSEHQSDGVNIYLLPQMMHGKGMVVDDTTAIFGSSNVDQTSFYDNYEANVYVRDPGMVSALKHVALGWIQKSRLLSPKEFLGRGVISRLRSLTAYQIFRLWHWRE